jgi:CheY-like chemotaxis protein
MTKSAPLLVTAIIKSKAQPRGRPFEKGNGYAVKPGEVRNRVGRRGPKPGAAAWAKLLSKGYTAILSSRVPNAIAKEHDLKNVTWAELIAFGMAKAAAKGDTAAAREIREVTEGKLAETMNLTGHIDYTAGQTAKDQLMARITGSGKSSELIESVDEEIFNVDLDNAHALKHPPVQPGRYARSEAHSEPDGQTILLVEDEAMISSNVRECLQQMGYQVVEARNGEAALEVCEQLHGKIDLVLSDLVMPGMAGYELARQLAQRYPAIRLLFMSGYSDDVGARRDILLQGSAFLQKPFSVADLSSAIHEALALREIFNSQEERAS